MDLKKLEEALLLYRRSIKNISELEEYIKERQTQLKVEQTHKLTAITVLKIEFHLNQDHLDAYLS